MGHKIYSNITSAKKRCYFCRRSSLLINLLNVKPIKNQCIQHTAQEKYCKSVLKYELLCLDQFWIKFWSILNIDTTIPHT